MRVRILKDKIMNKLVLILTSLMLLACGEETITQNTLKENFTSTTLQSFEVNTCAQMTFVKPPVDILYVIDNSGSTLAGSFQAIKDQISNTIFTISNDFDYHMYFAPLNAAPGDSIDGYPLLANNPSSLPNLASVNLVQPENLEMFASASGNNEEFGFERAKNLITFNRSNGIFRSDANTIVVMISNGDDTQSLTTIGGNRVFDSFKYTEIREGLKAFTKKYADANTVQNPLNAETFRFISLVAGSNCNGWTHGATYQMMSRDIYDYQAFSDNDSKKDTVDLCSQNYANLFKPVNNSIKAIVLGHKYDHWKISSSSESGIQGDDITVTKIKSNGDRVNIPEAPNDGFEYLGFQNNINTRYEPTPGEPVTGLVVKLNGNARVEYPDCIIAKTRTPTEYFGYVALPREPDLETVKLEVNGDAYPQDASNGWIYIGWRDTLNIKVPGPTGASINPPLNKSGYMLQLHGNAIFTNGDTINVFYKPKGK